MTTALKVNEIFYSIQGEGSTAGTAAIFIRLSGCNLSCSFCDTNHEAFTEMTVADIVSEIARYPSKALVVVTGGEPFLQDEPLALLLEELARHRDRLVQIETNGTLVANFVETRQRTWAMIRKNIILTVSPKAKALPSAVFAYADDVKLVYPDFRCLMSVAEAFCDSRSCLYLQPNAVDPMATRLAVNAVKDNPRWRLSLQAHKVIGIR